MSSLEEQYYNKTLFPTNLIHKAEVGLQLERMKVIYAALSSLKEVQNKNVY